MTHKLNPLALLSCKGGCGLIHINKLEHWYSPVNASLIDTVYKHLSTVSWSSVPCKGTNLNSPFPSVVTVRCHPPSVKTVTSA